MKKISLLRIIDLEAPLKEEAWALFVPPFAKALLDNPPLLPGETRSDFIRVFKAYASTPFGHAETDAQYWKACAASVLHTEIMLGALARAEMSRLPRTPEGQKKLVEALVDAGYGTQAVKDERLIRVASGLSNLEKMIASKEKLLTVLVRQLQESYMNRKKPN